MNGTELCHMWGMRIDELDRVVPHVGYEDRIYLINEIPLSEGHIWAMWIERDIIRERTLRDVNRKKKQNKNRTLRTCLHFHLSAPARCLP